MCWETKHVTRLTLLRYLFQGSGTEPAISLRRACAVYMNLHGSVYSNNCNQSTDFFPVTKLWGNKCRGSTFFPGIIILSLSKCIQVSAILFPEAGFNYVLPIFLKKKKRKYATIPLLGIHLGELKAGSQRNISPPEFIPELLTLRGRINTNVYPWMNG